MDAVSHFRLGPRPYIWRRPTHAQEARARRYPT